MNYEYHLCISGKGSITDMGELQQIMDYFKLTPEEWENLAKHIKSIKIEKVE